MHVESDSCTCRPLPVLKFTARESDPISDFTQSTFETGQMHGQNSSYSPSGPGSAVPDSADAELDLAG
jgi:hypothetical protein